MKTLLPALICLWLFFSCSSNEIGNSKDVNPETIYTSYEISYIEGDETVSCLARFRFGGKNGTTLVLTTPSNIQFDGTAIPVDSSDIAGAFYKVYKPVDGFEGNHSFVYTDINGKIYPEPFAFKPVKLVTPIPGEINAGGLPLAFEGLKDGDVINVEAADTSIGTEDINSTDTIRNGGILIPAASLEKLKNGPVEFEFYTDTNIPLDNATKEGGRLNLFYRLKQQKTLLKK